MLPPSSLSPALNDGAAITIKIKIDATVATAPSASMWSRSAISGAFQRGGGPGKRATTRASSLAAQAGSGTGRMSRRSISRSGIDGLPELGHGAVQERAGVRGADAEDLGDLGVGEVGVVLE